MELIEDINQEKVTGGSAGYDSVQFTLVEYMGERYIGAYPIRIKDNDMIEDLRGFMARRRGCSASDVHFYKDDRELDGFIYNNICDGDRIKCVLPASLDY